MISCRYCCNSYISENVDHFAAQISRVEALGQSRSKSSFARIGREQGGLEALPRVLRAANASRFVHFYIVVFLLNLVLWSEKR